MHLSGMLFVSICKDRSDSLLRPIAFHQTHLAFGLLTFPFSFPSSHQDIFSANLDNLRVSEVCSAIGTFSTCVEGLKGDEM